jgi:hypothetical protein
MPKNEFIQILRNVILVEFTEKLMSRNQIYITEKPHEFDRGTKYIY